MRRARWTLLVMVAVLASGAAACLAAEAAKPTKPLDRFKPIVVGTDDIPADKAKTPLPETAPPKPARPITVDEKARTVRVPVVFTRSKGVLEWLLAGSRKHPASAVLLADHAASDVADALAKIGFKPGTRPEAEGDERVRPPKGQAAVIEVVIRAADGKETRVPASRYLSEKAGGEPLGEGAWVYVGPQYIQESDMRISVSDLAGSIATTNPRDSSALFYWMPKVAAEASPFVRAYYASNAPLPAEGDTCEVVIRPPVSP